MSRAIFEPEHEAFRETVGTFLDKEVVPFHEQWEKDGIVDREVWAKAGAQGLLALQLPEEYGGGGTTDFRYNLVRQRGDDPAAGSTAAPSRSQRHDRALPGLEREPPSRRQRWLPGPLRRYDRSPRSP